MEADGTVDLQRAESGPPRLFQRLSSPCEDPEAVNSETRKRDVTSARRETTQLFLKRLNCLKALNKSEWEKQNSCKQFIRNQQSSDCVRQDNPLSDVIVPRTPHVNQVRYVIQNQHDPNIKHSRRRQRSNSWRSGSGGRSPTITAPSNTSGSELTLFIPEEELRRSLWSLSQNTNLVRRQIPVHTSHSKHGGGGFKISATCFFPPRREQPDASSETLM